MIQTDKGNCNSNPISIFKTPIGSFAGGPHHVLSIYYNMVHMMGRPTHDLLESHCTTLKDRETLPTRIWFLILITTPSFEGTFYHQVAFPPLENIHIRLYGGAMSLTWPLNVVFQQRLWVVYNVAEGRLPSYILHKSPYSLLKPAFTWCTIVQLPINTKTVQLNQEHHTTICFPLSHIEQIFLYWTRDECKWPQKQRKLGSVHTWF